MAVAAPGRHPAMAAVAMRRAVEAEVVVAMRPAVEEVAIPAVVAATPVVVEDIPAIAKGVVAS